MYHVKIIKNRIMEGYIYCFSNPSMHGILKVGVTERTPVDRLSEANSSDTWRPPTPYKIEFAKKVKNIFEKEKTIHLLLEQYTKRIHPRREFFQLMDGEMWFLKETDENEDDDAIMNDANENGKRCRDMTKCFTNGQIIRHKIGKQHTRFHLAY